MILKQLVYLDALARERHFRRAAEACHVSQPTLSEAIGQLEAELGVLIVERARQFRGFTREGEAVLAHARRVLGEMEQLKHALGELRQGVSGQLRLGVIPTALPMVAHVTAPFLDAYPAVSLAVLSLPSDEIQQRIDGFALDAGLTYLDNEPLERVVAKPLYRESYVLLLRAEDALAQRAAVTWAEAAALRLCLLTSDMQNRRIIDGIFRSVGQAPMPAMETNSIFNLCSHAGLRGLASIVSRQLLDSFGIPPGVVARPLVQPVAERSVGLIVADRTPMAPLARNLLASARAIADSA